MTRTVLNVLTFAFMAGCAAPDAVLTQDLSACGILDGADRISLHHDPAELADLFEHAVKPVEER
jgi:hypothetical protein